jgi:hypothetical protein
MHQKVIAKELELIRDIHPELGQNYEQLVANKNIDF